MLSPGRTIHKERTMSETTTDIEVGIDGENPVTPNNPLPKAQAEEWRGEPRQGQDASEFEPHVLPGSEEPTPGDDDKPKEGEGPEEPNKSASKADWAAYAVATDANLTAEEADKMTRDDLAAKYGS